MMAAVDGVQTGKKREWDNISVLPVTMARVWLRIEIAILFPVLDWSGRL